jgi:hypothetical protein
MVIVSPSLTLSSSSARWVLASKAPTVLIVSPFPINTTSLD